MTDLLDQASAPCLRWRCAAGGSPRLPVSLGGSRCLRTESSICCATQGISLASKVVAPAGFEPATQGLGNAQDGEEIDEFPRDESAQRGK